MSQKSDIAKQYEQEMKKYPWIDTDTTEALFNHVNELEAQNGRLRHQLQSAVYRIDDMLMGDDGQAWKEAEKARPAMQQVLDETTAASLANVKAQAIRQAVIATRESMTPEGS
ncbi:hypothetical protein HSBAA_30270 [Vreelandella sulfidaeris]|uniref:Uncharacterized protein n=1 Tax=Vreelandella sulfidaeris TaxID=115553 RepID=A0A455UAX6_9GAMM|nr:hypothetical protein HSBAA_30270 [Halomonas sulfidaeris]